MVGVNHEIAKNLVLAGVSLAIFDQDCVRAEDLNSNLFITEADIGGNRGVVCERIFSEMNSLVKIRCISTLEEIK